MRLKNKVIGVIRFWSDNAECSAQCGRSDNPEGRLTECRIIEVLLYDIYVRYMLNECCLHEALIYRLHVTYNYFHVGSLVPHRPARLRGRL